MHVAALLLLARVDMTLRSCVRIKMRPSSQHAHRWGAEGGGNRRHTRLFRSISQTMVMLSPLPPPLLLLLLLLAQLRTRLAAVYSASPAKQQQTTPDLCALKRGGGAVRRGSGTRMQNTEPSRAPAHALALPSPHAHVTPPPAL